MTERGLGIGILAFDGAMLSSIATVGDTVLVARAVAAARDPRKIPDLRCETFTCQPGGRVRTGAGVCIDALPGKPPAGLDLVLVPGLMHVRAHELCEQVAAMRDEIELLRGLAARGVRVAATCSGVFLLAEAGLLDGRRATTSWWLGVPFRKRYPRVRLEADAILIDDGGVLTTGAASSVQALVLRLIAEAGGEALAQQTARIELFDAERRSQAPYIDQALLERPRHSLAERIEHFLHRHLHDEVSVAGLAEHCRTSERSLLRHFQEHYGTSPLAHIQGLRVDRAKALLETTHLSFDEIVERCGYRDSASFRKLFKRATTLTPADYRQRFRLRPH